MLGSLGCFGLDNIGQDELDIWCLGVGQQLRGKLRVSRGTKLLDRWTHDTTKPSTGTGNEDHVARHFEGRF
jgi:hypothetical protein